MARCDECDCECYKPKNVEDEIKNGCGERIENTHLRLICGVDGLCSECNPSNGFNEEFNCGCVNHGNYEFKLCDEHREMVLDNIGGESE